MTELVPQSLVDDVREIVAVRAFESAWARVVMHHEVGQRILEERRSTPGLSLKPLVDALGMRTVGIRTLERCAQFAQQFPSLDAVPGEYQSWYKICNKLLPVHKEQKDKKPVTCPRCKGTGTVWR